MYCLFSGVQGAVFGILVFFAVFLLMVVKSCDVVLYRLEEVENNEELSDVYLHFKLYHGKDLIAMQNLSAAGEEKGSSTDKDVTSDSDNAKTLSIKQAKRYVLVVVINSLSKSCNLTGLVVLMVTMRFLV